MTEVKNKYETVLVLSAKLGEEGNAELVEKFKATIAKHGTVESVDDWGKRRLAYPINKETEGYYTLINFESTPDFTAELDRRHKITEGVLRSIIIKKEDKLTGSPIGGAVFQLEQNGTPAIARRSAKIGSRTG